MSIEGANTTEGKISGRDTFYFPKSYPYDKSKKRTLFNINAIIYPFFIHKKGAPQPRKGTELEKSSSIGQFEIGKKENAEKPVLQRAQSEMTFKYSGINTASTQVQTFAKQLELFVLARAQVGKIDPHRTLSKFLNQKALEVFNIPQLIKDAFQKNESDFLAPFIQFESLKTFIYQSMMIKKNEQLELIKIIGGQEVFLFLQSCLDPKMKLEWQTMIKKMLLLKQIVHHTSMKIKSYPLFFDRDYPISNVKKKDIVDPLTFFNKCESKDYFRLNGKPLPNPSFEGTEREVLCSLTLWLITHLNQAFGITSESVAQTDRDLVCEDIINEKQKVELIELLDPLLEKCKTQQMELKELLNTLQQNTCSKSFYQWCKKKLEKNLDDRFTQEIVELFVQDEWLRVCNKKVTSFRVLQALSFSAYIHATTNLRKDFATKLYHTNIQLLRMKPYPGERGAFAVNIDPESKTFYVDQIRKYHFITGSNSPYTEHGSVEVYWRVCGFGNSPYFSSCIWYDKLQLNKEIPFETRWEIVEKLGLISDTVELSQL